LDTGGFREVFQKQNRREELKILIVGFMHPKEDKRVLRTVKTLSEKHNETKKEFIYSLANWETNIES